MVFKLLQSNLATAAPFTCQITNRDIEDMRDRYDSGMFDQTRSNAISLALQRAFPGNGIQVVRRGTTLMAQSSDAEVELGPGLAIWLRRLEAGCAEEPVSFVFPAPACWA